MKKITKCPKYDFLYCSLPRRKNTCHNLNFPCIGDVVDNLENRAVLEEDARLEGYSFTGIEDYIDVLNSGRSTVHRTDGSDVPLSFFIENESIVPYTVAEDKKFLSQVDGIPHHHGRGSQYSSSKCPISVLYSHLNTDKLKEIMNRQLKPPRSTVAGSLRHDIVSFPGLMHELQKYSRFGVPRKLYTEKRVAYRFPREPLKDDLINLFAYMAGESLNVELWDLVNFREERRKYGEFFLRMGLDYNKIDIEEFVVKGTADGILRFKWSPILALIDWKRSRYYKNAFGLQMAAYSLGVQQLSQEDFDSIFLISVINNYGNQAFDYSKPGNHITQITEEDILVNTMQLKTVFLHSVITFLARDVDLYLDLWDSQRELKETKFRDEPATSCEVLYSGTPCVNLENGLCDMAREFVFEGGSLADLLIDGFQLGA